MHLLDTLTEGLKEIDARGLRRRRRTADTPCAAPSIAATLDSPMTPALATA